MTTKTFVGTDTIYNWFDANNWSPSGVPGSGDVVAITQSNTVGNPVVIEGTDAKAASIAISGGVAGTVNALGVLADATLETGGLNIGTQGWLIIDGGAKMTSTTTIIDHGVIFIGGTDRSMGTNGAAASGAADTGTLSADVEIESTGSLIFNTNGDAATTYSGTASGAGVVIQEGTSDSIVTLSGTNTYSGGTSLSSGMLIGTNGSAFGTGVMQVVGNASGGGTLTLQNASTTTTSIFTNALTLYGYGVKDPGAFSGALRNDFGNNTWSGNITLATDSQIDVVQDELGISGQVTGTGKLIKTDDGLLLLNNFNNSYSGGTEIAGGTIEIDSGQALGTNTVQVDGGATLSFVAFPSDLFTNALTVSGDGFKGGGALQILAGTLGFLTNITLSANARINTDQLATLQDDGEVAGTGTTLTVGGDGDADFNGEINLGTGGLIKDGNGTVTLTAANIFGAITINAGTLVAGDRDVLGSDPVTVAAGSTLQDNFVDPNASDPIGNALTITGNGVGNNGAIDFTADGAISGAITLGADARIDSENSGSAGDNATISSAITGAGHTLTVGGTGTLDITGAIKTSAGGLIKDGSGTVTLAGANTYTGMTEVMAGTLVLDSGSAIANTGAVQVDAGGTLEVKVSETIGALNGSGHIILDSGATLTVSGGGSFSGTISGAGGLTETGTSTLILSGTNSYTGATAVLGGTLDLQNGSALADNDAVTVGANGTLKVDTSETIGALAGSGVIELGNATLTVSGGGLSGTITQLSGDTGSFVKTGAGTLVLTGTESYTGTTTVNGGSLHFGNGGTSGAPGTGAIVDNANVTFNLNVGGGAIISNNISGSGGVTFAGNGTYVLNGTNTYSGATQIGGILDLSGTGASGSNSAFVLELSTSQLHLGAREELGSLAGVGAVGLFGNALFVGSDNTSTTYAGLIYGAQNGPPGPGPGSLVKVGTGTLTLTGTSEYTGTTTISQGTLQYGNGKATGVGVPGPGAITDNASLIFDEASNLTIANAISGSGSVTFTGTATYTLTAANSYLGGTKISGGATVAITATKLPLSKPGVEFTGSGGIEAVAIATLVNLVTIDAGATVTFGAASGDELIISNGITDNQGAGTKLQFGSSTETGTVKLAPGSLSDAGGESASINGGTLILGNANASKLLGDATGGLSVGTSQTLATLNLSGQSLNAYNLSSTAAGVIVNNGTTAAELDLFDTSNTTFAGGIKDGASTISVVAHGGGGTLTLTHASTYSGGTKLVGGAITINNAAALGTTGTIEFAAASAPDVLITAVNATLANQIVIDDGAAATFGSTGKTLTMTGDFVNNQATGSTLHFGSAKATGVVVLDPTTTEGNIGGGALSIDGGTLRVGNANAASIVSNAIGLTVGSSTTAATLDLHGEEVFAINLAGTSAGIITNTGATTTLDIASTSDTSFAGVIKGAIAVDIENFFGEPVATLTLTGASTYTGGTVISDETVAIGNMAALGNSSVLLENDATLNATITGVLKNQLRVDNLAAAALGEANGATLTLSGGVVLQDGSTLALQGAIKNNGSITLGSSAEADIVAVSNASATLTNAGTIFGVGQIGESFTGLTLVNLATGIIAPSAGATMTIDTGNTVVNSGVFEAESGSTLVLDDNVSGAGTANIYDNSRIDIHGSMTNAVTFENLGGIAGVLILDAQSTFKSTIAGFAAGASNQHDTIDLEAINFAASDTWSFTQTTLSQGVLTVADASSDIVRLTLLGQYLAAANTTVTSASSVLFTLASDTIDHSSGTLVTTIHT